MPYFLIGLMIGIVLWFFWTAPTIAILLTGLLVFCVLLNRFRLSTAFVIGFIIGIS